MVVLRRLRLLRVWCYFLPWLRYYSLVEQVWMGNLIFYSPVLILTGYPVPDNQIWSLPMRCGGLSVMVLLERGYHTRNAMVSARLKISCDLVFFRGGNPIHLSSVVQIPPKYDNKLSNFYWAITRIRHKSSELPRCQLSTTRRPAYTNYGRPTLVSQPHITYFPFRATIYLCALPLG